MFEIKELFSFPRKRGAGINLHDGVCVCVCKNKPIHLCIININCCCMNSGRCMSAENGNGDGF